MSAFKTFNPKRAGDATHRKGIGLRLLGEFGMYAGPINYPTMPRGQHGLRGMSSPAAAGATVTSLLTQGLVLSQRKAA